MLSAKDFEAEAIDEIVAETELWGQKVPIVLAISLDEDEENEKRYIKKAKKVIEKNISVINEKMEYLRGNKEAFLNQLMEYNPVPMVQEYIDNILSDELDTPDIYLLSDSTEIKLPLTETEFLEKLLICEAVHFDIDAFDEEDELDITITVSFGVKDTMTGGHGWDIEAE